MQTSPKPDDQQQQQGFIHDKQIIQIDYKCRFNSVPKSIKLNPFTRKSKYLSNTHINNKQKQQKYQLSINLKQNPFIDNSLRQQVLHKILKKQHNHTNIIYNNYNNNEISISQSDSNILFDSEFPMSNLQIVSRVKNGHYNVYMRPDTNTQGNFQWFYFRVYVKKKKIIKFTIKNFIKSTMLYSQGLRPFYMSKMQAKKDKQNKNNNNSSNSYPKYTQISQQVHFTQDQQTQYFNLTFSFEFLYDNDQVQFCSQPPYGLNELQNTIQKLKNCKRYVMGKTILGKKISYLVVNQNIGNLGKDKQKQRNGVDKNVIDKYNNHNSNHNNNNHNNNQRIYDRLYDKIKQKTKLQQHKIIAIAIARQHPGQAVGSWMMDGFMNQINNLKFSPLIKWIIVPMVNIDGVQLGNNRTGALGHDFNRNWNVQQGSKKQKMFPQNSCILNYIRKLKRKYPKKIKMFLDLHGHSSQQNVFTYGPPHSEKTQGYYMSRMFPQLLSKKNQNFKLSQSSYNINPDKKNTARSIFINELKIPFTYTIECTFGIMNSRRISCPQIIKIGQDIAISANEFLQNLYLKQQSIQNNMLLNSIKQKYSKIQFNDEIDQYQTASQDSQKYGNNNKRKLFQDKLEGLLDGKAKGKQKGEEEKEDGQIIMINGNGVNTQRSDEIGDKISNNLKSSNKSTKNKNNLKILRSQTLQTKSKYHSNQQFNQDFSRRPYRKSSQSNSLIKSVFIYDQSTSLNSSVDYPNSSSSPTSKHKKSLRFSTQPNIFDQCAYFPPIKNNRSQQIYQKGILNKFPNSCSNSEHIINNNKGQVQQTTTNNNTPMMNMKQIQQRLFKLRNSKIGKRILVINAYGV